MTWSFGFLKWVAGREKRCRTKSTARSPGSPAHYYRRLRCEPLECRRLLTAATITGVNPACPVATGSAQTFTINGSNFQSGLTVKLLNGSGNPPSTMSITSQSSTKIVTSTNLGSAQDVWSVEVIDPGDSSPQVYYFPTTPSSWQQPDALGVDYSDARPTPSALTAAGGKFVVRYVDYIGNPKDITVSEARSLLGAGQQIIIVFESTGTEMQNGYNQGVADAQAAANEAVNAGAPSNFVCYFAADFDPTNYLTDIDNYLKGADSVLGENRVGIYGGIAAVSSALSNNLAQYGWQTLAWSNGQEYLGSGLSLYQDNNVDFVSGCDADVAIGSNYGQWTPAGLSASATGDQSISVSWQSMGVATGYTLEHATSSSGPWTQAYSGSSTSYTDSGLQFGTKYYYEVCGTNGGGSTSFSSSVSATTLPGVPTGLTATVTGPQSISVSWNTVSGATSYSLQRATSSSGPWTQVYSNSTPSYSNTGLQSGTTYYYEVSASYATGSSAYSSPVSATTSPTVTIASPTSGQAFTTFPITVSGTATDTGGTGLKYVTVTNTANGSSVSENLSGTSASYSISGFTLAPGQNVINVESFDEGNYHSTVVAVTVNYNPLTWNGGGSPIFFWNTAADWGGTALAAGDELDFGGSTGLSNINNHTAGTQFGNLTFDSTAGAFKLSGNSLDLTGVIANYSASSQTISLALSGTSGLTKTGSGTVILSGANSYTGNTVVNQGKLIVTQPAALPNGGNLTIGAHALTDFGPLVPAAAPASSSAAKIAKTATFGTHPATITVTAGEATATKPRTYPFALPATWAAAVGADSQQRTQPVSIAAWDAALAEYGREA